MPRQQRRAILDVALVVAMEAKQDSCNATLYHMDFTLTQEQLAQLQMRSQQDETKKTYAFWETQPVAQFTEDASTSQSLEVIVHVKHTSLP